MAKLISLMHLSFDGFAASSDGGMDWITHDQKIFEHVSKFIAKVGTGVYGPKTFQMMEGYWPSVLNNSKSSELELKHAHWYHNTQKIVCSRHLTQLENSNVKLINTSLETKFKKLKQDNEKDMMVFGSPLLTQSLAKLDLFDEYVININPVLIGGGVRMFDELPRTKLELISATTFSSGVVGFHYAKKMS